MPLISSPPATFVGHACHYIAIHGYKVSCGRMNIVPQWRSQTVSHVATSSPHDDEKLGPLGAIYVLCEVLLFVGRSGIVKYISPLD